MSLTWFCGASHMKHLFGRRASHASPSLGHGVSAPANPFASGRKATPSYRQQKRVGNHPSHGAPQQRLRLHGHNHHACGRHEHRGRRPKPPVEHARVQDVVRHQRRESGGRIKLSARTTDSGSSRPFSRNKGTTRHASMVMPQHPRIIQNSCQLMTHLLRPSSWPHGRKRVWQPRCPARPPPVWPRLPIQAACRRRHRRSRTRPRRRWRRSASA